MAPRQAVGAGKVLGLWICDCWGSTTLMLSQPVGRLLGLDFPVIAKSIATFEGASRRFEFRGEANGIVFIDDYAHH